MKESVYQKKVLALLRERGAYAEVISGGGFQASGIPDILACYKGIWLGLELKVGYNKPSPLQVAKIDLIRQAGGVGAVVWERLGPIEDILDCIDWFTSSLLDRGELDHEFNKTRYKYNIRKDSL